VETHSFYKISPAENFGKGKQAQKGLGVALISYSRGCRISLVPSSESFCTSITWESLTSKAERGNFEVSMSETLKIYTYPDPVLRTPTEEVVDIDEETQKLIDQMAETMYAAPGIGLAANQVGVAKSIVVYDLTPKDKGRNLSVLINPEIVSSEGRIVFDEACLSVIDFSAEVARSAMVKVRGFDRHGRPVDIEAEGLLAICLQHEIDHLKGKLFIDYVSSLKRALYKKKLKKMMKKSKVSNT